MLTIASFNKTAASVSGYGKPAVSPNCTKVAPLALATIKGMEPRNNMVLIDLFRSKSMGFSNTRIK
jgi:hypothetical protein